MRRRAGVPTTLGCCSVALLVLRCTRRVGLLSSQVCLMFPINGELVPAIGGNCQLLLEDELSFADCKAESCSFLSKYLLGVFMCFHFCAGEEASLICAACDCTLRGTNVVFAVWVQKCLVWSVILFLWLTYGKCLLLTQIKAEDHLVCLVVLTQHPFADCKSKQALRRDGE